MTQQTLGPLTDEERTILKAYRDSTTHWNTETLINLCLCDIDQCSVNLFHVMRKYLGGVDYSIFCSTYLDSILSGVSEFVQEEDMKARDIESMKRYIDMIKSNLGTEKNLVEQYNDPTTRG